MTIPVPTDIYHITHIDNLASIVRSGGLRSHNKMLADGSPHQSVAHQDIQDYRSHKNVADRLNFWLRIFARGS